MPDLVITENEGKQKAKEILGNVGLLWLLLRPFIYYFIGLKRNGSILLIAFIELTYIIIILAEIFLQRENLVKNNFDKFSIFLLLVLGCVSYSGAPIIIDYINKTIYLIAGIGFFIWPKLLQKAETTIPSNKSFLLMVVGFFIGVLISIIKILLNGKFGWIISARDNPVILVSAIVLSFTTPLCQAEFIYRGFLWHTLKRIPFNTPLIILTTTLLWTFSNPRIWNNIPEIINFIMIGILLGICTWKTKSISMNIGILAGYSVLLMVSHLTSYPF